MKKLLAIIVVSLSTFTLSTAAADSDFTPRWLIGPFSGNGAVFPIEQVNLDIELTSRFMTASGIFTTGPGSSYATSGSCFETSTGGVTCSLSLLTFSVILRINGDLNGTIQVWQPNGEAFVEANVVFAGEQ